VLLHWYESRNIDPPHGLGIGRYYIPSNYGEGKAFRDWLFEEYGGAEIVKLNKKAMIRFVDEQQLIMFSLKWS
jgi:hypothetical protein